MGNGCKVCVCALLLLAASCTSRPTDEDWEKNGRVRVVLDWGTRAAAHTGVFDYYFYAEGSNRPLVRRSDASGYEGTLPQGRYSVVVCNPDGTNLDLSMENGYAAARAIARMGASAKAATATLSKAVSSLMQQPGNLYGAGLEGVSVMPAGGNPVVITPVCLTRAVSLRILIRGGGELVVAGGELSGIPPEVCIPTGQLGERRSASVRFATAADGTNCYTASLSLFGLRAGSSEVADAAILSLTVQQKNGQSFTSQTDVSEQVNEAAANELVSRIELDMEVQPTATGGLTFVLAGWRTGTAEAEADTK